MSCTSYLAYLPSIDWELSCGITSIFICITASIENIIILLTLSWYKNLHTSTNGLLASLALSDLLVGLTLAPLHALQLLSPNLLNHCLVDEIRRYLSTLLIGASAFTIGGISYDRYLHMSKLMNYRDYMSKKKVTGIIFFCWLIPALIPVIRYVFKSEKAYFSAIVIGVALVLGTLLACYILIIASMRYRGRWIHISRQFEERQLRTLRTVIIILTTFILMILPICLHHIVFIAFPTTDIHTKVKLYMVGQTLAMLNSSANPVIYYFRNPEFRANLRKILHLNFSQNNMDDRATAVTKTNSNASCSASSRLNGNQVELTSITLYS